MFFALRKFAHGLRQVGPRYLLRVVPNELARPRLALTRRLRRLLVAAHDRCAPVAASRERPPDCLQFVYDLATGPLTFDFATYLAAAEVERRRRGLGGIEVVFVPGRHAGVRPELPAYEAVFDREARLWRWRNVVVPMLALLPSVRGYTVCRDREQAAGLIGGAANALYPADYRVLLPRQPGPSDIHGQARSGTPIWPLLRASHHARRLAADFLRGAAGRRRAIVITLRDSGFASERNSRVADWVAFADSLDPEVYAPVFVCDSDTVLRRPPEIAARHPVCHAASWSLELRAGLYEAAWLNVAIMHGPLELCWYNEQARYLLFMPLAAGSGTSIEMMAENGLEIGVDLAFARPWQRLIWQPDRAEIIAREFARMVPALAALQPEDSERSTAHVSGR